MCPTPPPPIRDPQDPPLPRARPLRRDPAPPRAPPGSPAAWPGGARWRRRKGLGRGPAPPAGNSTGTGCWGHRRVLGAPRGGPRAGGAVRARIRLFPRARWGRDPAASPTPQTGLLGDTAPVQGHPPKSRGIGLVTPGVWEPLTAGSRTGESQLQGSHTACPTQDRDTQSPPGHPAVPVPKPPGVAPGVPRRAGGHRPGQWQRLAVPQSVLGTQLGSSTQSSGQKWMCQRDTRPSRSRQAPDGGSDQDECLCLCARQHRPVQAWVSPEFSNVTEKHRERCYGCYCF